MIRLARAFVAALLCCACHAAFAAGWTLTLPSGHTLSIIEGSTATRSGYFVERQFPGGARDPQFGSAGRVFFTLGSDNGPPAAIQVDAAGRILIAGATAGAEGHSAVAVVRFLPGGQPDVAWGQQGRSLIGATQADASAADLLPLGDGSVLVLGTIDDNRGERAALWHLRGDGRLDADFGSAGSMVAAGVPDSQGLSIQQTDDGTVHLGVQSGRGDPIWLEVHRWNSGAEAPQRIARQLLPDDWVGPPVLTRRGDGWVWADASQPMTAPLELVAVAADSPWQGSAPAALARPAETASATGHAVLNPFGEGSDGAPVPAPGADDITGTGLWAAAAAALLALGGWWTWRSGRKAGSAALDARSASGRSLTRGPAYRARDPRGGSERMKESKPASKAREAIVQPLNHTRAADSDLQHPDEPQTRFSAPGRVRVTRARQLTRALATRRRRASPAAAQTALTMPATAESSDVEIRRPMRGFGLRSGRIGPGQARALEVLGPRYLLPYSESPCDFGIAFGRNAPRIVEIGFGMGEAIAARARALPQADFIGIDVHSPGVGALLKRIGEFELTNLRVIQHDAVDVLRHMVAPETLAGVLLFFPDPWHKRRRHRRRLVQPAFVHLLASRLQRGGRLRCTTDWQPYAQQILEVLSAEPLLRSAPCGFAERSTYRPPTNFEPRGLKLGHGVWDLVFVRR